jgi:hypothetical protein
MHTFPTAKKSLLQAFGEFIAWLFLATLLLLSGMSLNEPNHGLTTDVPVFSDDLTAVYVSVSDLVQAIRTSNALYVRSCLSSGFAINVSPGSVDIKARHFSIEITSVAISGDTAYVVYDANDAHSFSIRGGTLSLRREGLGWKISNAEAMDTLIAYAATSGKDSRESEPRSIMNSSSFIRAPYSLVSRPHPGTSAYLITRALTQQPPISRSLFADDAVLSMDAISPDTNAYKIGFIADGYWDRIVYGKQDPNDRWIRSFGDNAADPYRFRGSYALSIDTFDTVFVADRYSGRIAKLFYNRTTGFLSFVTAFSVPGVRFPSDIVFYPNFTPCTTTDGDYIWVAEESGNQVVRVTREGAVTAVIQYYEFNSVRYPLSRPKKILVSPLGSSTYWSFIDGNRNAFVTCYLPLIDDFTVQAVNVTEFDVASSELTCIGFDWNKQWWVGDATAQMYHTFSYRGDYISSIDADKYGATLFVSPHSVTRPTLTTKYCDGYMGIFGSLGIITADTWSSSGGLRFFYPGADILGLSVSEIGDGFEFHWRLSNRSNRLLKNS